MVIFRFLGQNDLKLELHTFDFKNEVVLTKARNVYYILPK